MVSIFGEEKVLRYSFHTVLQRVYIGTSLQVSNVQHILKLKMHSILRINLSLLNYQSYMVKFNFEAVYREFLIMTKISLMSKNKYLVK